MSKRCFEMTFPVYAGRVKGLVSWCFMGERREALHVRGLHGGDEVLTVWAMHAGHIEMDTAGC